MRRLLQRLVLYGFHIIIARPVLKWLVGVRYRRRHLIPQGPCLVVANHNSHLDAAILMSMFPLRRLARIHPVAAADYFGANWFMRVMAMLCMNGIPIQRKPPRGTDPLSPLMSQLQSGESLIFFPEGSRGEAGVVAKFRSGIGMIVRSTPGLLVVPVFLSGPERIWPRGNLVPVPFSIDANIGRPRTYQADEEPKAIAERVREDVLALAPPPPPAAGARPSSPIRVAVCGVDEESRDEVFRRVTERLGRIERTLGVSDQVTEADARGIRETTGPIAVGLGRAWLGLLAGIFRTRGRFKGERFVATIEKAWVNEALSTGLDAGFVAVDGSALVDLMAWSAAGSALDETRIGQLMHYLSGHKKVPLRRWWTLLREAPEVWLINVFNLARPPIPDVLVHLKRPTPLVMERLRSRGGQIEPYENEAFLGRLRQAYCQVSGFLMKRQRVQIVELDLSEMGPEEAASRVEAVCRRLAEESRAAAPAT